MKKVFIVDGNSILNRAFYGVRPLTNSNGLPTNALFGMLSILRKQLSDVRPDCAAVAFDLHAPTFRHKKYAEYKAGRKKMPDELALQLPYAKRLCEALGMTILEKEGYEADDILGTVSRMANEANAECFILTGDRDSLQLIGGGTTVLLATNKDTVRFDRDRFFEEYGVEPETFVDVKALMGDHSDNIPGVPGIGEKTALKLIADRGSLDNVYLDIDNAGLGKSAKQKMLDGKESAYLSKWLATIDRNVPLAITLDDLRTDGADNAALYKLLSELEFTAIIKRLGLTPPNDRLGGFSRDDVTPNPDFASENAKNDPSEASGDRSSETVSSASPSGSSDTPEGVRCDPKTVIKEISIDPSEISGLAGKRLGFSYDGSEAAFFDGETAYVCDFGNFDKLANTVSGCDLSLILYDYKKCCSDFADAGQTLKCSDDVMLAAYVLSPSQSSYDMVTLCNMYLDCPAPGLSSPAAQRAYALYGISRAQRERLEELSQTELYEKTEIPLAAVLSDMERSGFMLDVDGLTGFSERLAETEEGYVSGIYELAGKTFNVNSPKQLGEVLFETLGLKAGKKTKTGYSTGAEVLEKLKGEHPIVEKILEYRAVAKLRATYAEGLLRACDGRGFVHTSFNQTTTVTGRLSSTEPNLQNIPVRSELGREMRRFFVAKGADRVLIDADYSQIELRLLAHIAGDENMIKAFLSGEDIHAVTASQVFGVPLSEVTPELRKRAKAVNFGIVYGIGEFKLASDLGISRAEAGNYIKSYFSKYRGIAEYLDAAVESAKKLGYVDTIFGRRRYVPELTSQKAVMRAFGERVAMNSPIQGSSADIIKMAMINVSSALKEEGLDAILILQVHDELIVDSAKSCAMRAAEVLKREMENVVKLSVPLTVDVGIGENWFDI